MSRDYQYLEKAGITLALDVTNGIARVALAACNTEDTFSRKAGRAVVDAILDKDATTLNAFQLTKNCVQFPYDKNKPRQHILHPLIYFLADELKERMFFRQLHKMFMDEITSLSKAAEIAQSTKNETIYYEFKKVISSLDESSIEVLDLLEDEHEFYQVYFKWNGSFDYLMTKLRDFASAVHTKKIVLQDAVDKPKLKSSQKRAIAAMPMVDS